MTPTTDLIDRSLNGDRAAFGELVRRYQDRLYNMVYRLVGSVEDAQDIVQDVFLIAYQSLRNFRGESAFFTWLYRIAVNTAVSLRRKQRLVSGLERGWNQGPGFEPLDESDFARPGYGLEQAEEERRIQTALNRLSPEHRVVLILKDMEGQKYDVMARVLGVPVGTIRSRIHRARAELRGVLAEPWR